MTKRETQEAFHYILELQSIAAEMYESIKGMESALALMRREPTPGLKRVRATMARYEAFIRKAGSGE